MTVKVHMKYKYTFGIYKDVSLIKAKENEIQIIHKDKGVNTARIFTRNDIERIEIEFE